MHKPRHILISHVYSAHNKGDAALLSVLIRDLRRQFGHESRLTILTLDSVTRHEEFDGVPVINSFMFYAMKRFSNNFLTFIYALFVMSTTLAWSYVYARTGKSLPIPRKLKDLCTLYAEADLVVPVGGGYIRSQKGGIGSLLNVSLLLHPLQITHILHRPTVLYTQSIGPFANKLEQATVRHALNTYVCAAVIREDTTMALLMRIGVKREIMHRSVDSGFAFTAGDASFDLRKTLGVKKDKLLFGITARKWLQASEQDAYEHALAEVVRYIVESHHAAVVFIPQVTAVYHGDDDRIVQQRILKIAGVLDDVYALDRSLDHYDIKAAYDALDLVIGTRFHSVIFSLTSYVPAIAIEYEHKTGGIMHDLGLDMWVLKIEDVNMENLRQKVDKLMVERTGYKQYLQRVMPAYIRKVDAAIKVVAACYAKSEEK